MNGNNLIWDTGRVESDQSVHISYVGPTLHSGQRVYWRVRAWTNKGESDWSQPAFWEMGLLKARAWQANWIEPDLVEDYAKSNPCPMLRREFQLKDKVKRVRAYVTAHGLCEIYINGKRVGEQVFTPGWTSYQDHIQYHTFNVTELLQSGDNAVGAYLDDGWYRGNLGFRGQRNVYGRKLALLVQIHVQYENGESDILGTDDTWRCSTGPLLMSDIYNGEIYDARLEQDGWTAAGFDDSGWKDVTVRDFSKENLAALAGPPVRKIEELKPVDILVTPEGDTVVDMGQNMVGWVRLRVAGDKGTTVTLRHAEVLDKHDNVYTENLRSADQQSAGQIPHVILNILSPGKKQGESAASGWADAAVIVPWTVYLSYGDTRILKQQYESMKGWVDYMARRAGDSYFYNTDYTFGDWLAFSTDRSDYPGATTSKDLVSQAYFSRSTDILVRTATLLGKTGDVKTYSALLEQIKDVFVNEFITPNGRVASHTQTAYSLALAFDLVPDSLKDSAARRLTEDVRTFKHITTGFLGTPLICHVLGEYGYYDEAFMLLNRTDYPSWLYPVTRNATTIWERWDGIKPDGSFQNPGMNSFNHYAYGAIGEWLYRVVAGIEIDEKHPGYKHIIIQPHPGGDLNHVQAEHHSLYGTVVSDWSIEKETFTLRVRIPCNTTATVFLPKTDVDQVTESGEWVGKSEGVINTDQAGDQAVVDVGSGAYVFQYAY